MAATTCGWQCPVDVTAIPAEKSKNSFPSTSVTTIPRPLFATSGYDRVYDGEIYFASPSSTRLALGPGRAVLILGPAVAVIVLVMIFLRFRKARLPSYRYGQFLKARPESCRQSLKGATFSRAVHGRF